MIFEKVFMAVFLSLVSPNFLVDCMLKLFKKMNLYERKNCIIISVYISLIHLDLFIFIYEIQPRFIKLFVAFIFPYHLRYLPYNSGFS